MRYSDSEITRFWAKVAIKDQDDCWLWTGSIKGLGYGSFRTTHPRKTKRSHVVAFELAKGPALGMMVCHSCDVRLCCNPQHLWLGTNSDNQRDSFAKGRGRSPGGPGEDNGNAKLNEKQVRDIRKLIERGDTNTSIAQLYGVTHSNISRIRRGLSWTHIT